MQDCSLPGATRPLKTGFKTFAPNSDEVVFSLRGKDFGYGYNAATKAARGGDEGRLLGVTKCVWFISSVRSLHIFIET